MEACEARNYTLMKQLLEARHISTLGKQPMQQLISTQPDDTLLHIFLDTCVNTLDFSEDDLEVTLGDALRTMVHSRLPRRQIEIVLRMFGWKQQ